MTQDEREVMEAYRTLFLDNPTGRLVLQHMLVSLKYFDTLDPEDYEQITLHNYAVSILARLGVLEPETLPQFTTLIARYWSNVTEFVKRLALVSPPQRRTEGT